MLSIIFCTIAVAASRFTTIVRAAPSCSDTKDHFMNGSTRNNTLSAGMDLMAYFNDPSRNGMLKLPALGGSTFYTIERQVGI
jgi:hypothetical protein